MKRITHKNLYEYYGNKDEFYAALQEHLDRDTWFNLFWHWVFIACALGAFFISGHKDWLWIFGGIYATERVLSNFIDNSNRNWFMHHIDYLEYKNHTQSSNEY